MTTFITIVAFFGTTLLVMALLMAIATAKDNKKLRQRILEIECHNATMANELNFYHKENKHLHQVLSMQCNNKPSYIDNNEGD